MFKKRKELGEFHNLIPELRAADREYFFRYFRMNPERFDHLLELVGDKIVKKDTRFRKSISAKERLAVTLKFLASGDAQQSISYSYRIGKSTVSKIIAETCEAIYQSLDKYLCAPKDSNDWLRISKDFEELWNFPHVLGALDGKHIRIECPKKSGSLYYNYKGFFSIVLMAMCDARYCFTLFDLGHYGSNNDSGILNQSEMGSLFEQEQLHLPAPAIVEGCSLEPLPYFVLGDEIFPLKEWLMRPFPGNGASEEQRVYNYRHSRARRVIENAFGVMVARWRILLKPIKASVKNAEKYVLAYMALHNYLRQTNTAAYCPTCFLDLASGNIRPGEWCSSIECDINNGCFQRVNVIRGRRNKLEPVAMRHALANYLGSEEGSLPWQLDYVRRTSNYQ